MSRDIAGRAVACAGRLLRNERRFGRRIAASLAWLIVAISFYSPAAFADRNFGVRFNTDDNGAITLIGNTLMSCVQGTQNPPATCISTVPGNGTGATGANLNDNNYNMAYVNTVGGTGIFNSSSANFTRASGSTVLWAGLYWSGETVAGTNGVAPPNAAIRNQVRFSTPASGGFQTITANQLDTTAGIGGGTSGFNGFADVTTLVQAGGSGTYAVGNVQAATGQNRYAGWALVVVYHDASLPLRDLTVFDGYIEVSTTTVSNTISGFRTPATGAFSTAVGAVAFDGDLGSTGDAMRLNGIAISDAANPAANFYNSTVSLFGANVTTRNPPFGDTLGVDVDLINTSGILPNGATSATVAFVASSGDTYFPDVLTFSTDVFQPDFTSPNGFTKTVSDLNGGSALAGDVIEYTVAMTNTGNDLAAGVVMNDAIPANTTYVPGSLTVLTGANVGTKSDAAGDDQAEFTGTSVRFRLGTGANATTGGNVTPGGSTSVRFRVQINAGTPANTVISNQAALNYIGATLGTPFSASSDGDPTTPGTQPTTLTTGAPPSATLSLSKIGTPDPVVPGNQLTYTLTVTNSGPSPAANTVVTDTTPTNTTFASASAPPGWTITAPAVGSAGTVQFTNASLPVGTYALTLVVNVNAGAPAPGTISNTATVASPTDVNGDVTSTSTNTTPAQNLTITKNGPGSVGQNQDIAYSITVNNPGPLNASTVSVTDPTPANTTFVSANVPPGWTITSPAVGATGTVTFANPSLPPGTYALNLTLHVTTAAAVGATVTNTATLASPSDSNPGDNVATSAAIVRNPVPTVVKRFTPASVPISGDSTLSLVITNNANVALTALALSDPLPPPVVVSPTPAATNSCGGTLSAVAGSATVALTAGTLAAGPGTTCTITVNVRSATAGTFVNTTGNVSATQTGTGSGATATLDVAALLSAPVTKTFNPASIGAGGTSVMTIAFTNPNAAAVTGVAFTDTYPAGLANVASGLVIVGNTCGGTLTAVNGGTSTALTGGSIPVGGCAIQINVTAQLAGTYVNSTGTISEGNAVDNAGASGTLTTTTLSAPTASKAFTPATVQLGAASQMTITLTNPNAIAISNAAFNDTYPAGIQNAASGVVASNSCGGAVNAPAGGTSAAFAGGTIPASGSCAIVVNVVATALGAQVNSTGAITSNNAANGASASGTLTVTPLTAPATTKSFSPATVDVGGASQMTISIANPNALALTGVAFTDTYPAGLANAAAGVIASNTCGGTVTANTGGTSTALTGGTVPAASTCAIVINVVATAPGSLVNSTGPITSTNGLSGTGASGTLTVNPSANLAVVKTGPTSVGYGGAIAYTVVASNAGPSAANGASFSDAVPTGITGITANCVPAGAAACGTVSVVGNLVTSTITTLPSGGSVTFTISGTAPTSGASLSNTATIAPPAGTTDPNGTNNTSTATTTLTPAQLTTAKTATPNPFIVGQPARYDITVQNTGAGVTTAPIVITDTLAAGITLASASGANWNCVGTTALTCTFSGTLAAGASTTLTLNVSVTAAATTANNTATTSGGGDPTCPPAARCVGTVVVPVTASADIVVDKTVDNATPNVGETITFTVGATNAGPSNATSVRVTDALPSGLAFVSAAPSQGSYDSSTGNWTIGSLANGATATLDIVASVLTPGVLTNIATRTGGDQLDPDASNNSAQASVNAQPTADLQVAKTVNNALPNLGTNVVYTITLTNAGPDDATGVALIDQLPAGLAFVAATPSQGSYDSVTGIWTVGALANADAATLAITATVTLPGDITNTASVDASDQFDPNTANNSGGVTLNGQSADIQIVKTVDNANPVVGDSLTFTITATNNGPSNATGIAVTDLLPAALTFISATPTQGSYDNTTGVWTLGSLSAAGAGSSATLTVVAAVDIDGGFTNTAAVSANDQPDPNPANNSSSVVVTPIASADLAIVKTGPASVIAGQQIAYALGVTNNGPSSATNAVLDDPTPAGLAFVSATAPCTGGFPCNLGTLAASAVVNVTATFAVPSGATGSILNIATVDSDTLDPNGANDSSTISTSIVRQADLLVVKTGPATVVANGAISYSVVVTNNGPSDANGTTFTDAVPAAISGVTAACGVQTGGVVCGAVNVAGNNVSSTITTLPASGSVTFTISGTAPANGASLGNTATAAPPGGVTDPDTSDNSSTVTTTVTASADVSVVKTGPAAATPGSTVTYTIDVHNAGPSTATSVQVLDPTPAGLAFVSSTPCTTGFPCALGDLASGADVTITVTYAIPANYPGTSIVNTASITSPTADPDPTDNSSSAMTPTAAVADLSVLKTGPASVSAAGVITYTVVVTNAGPGDVAGAQFTDPVPVAITGLGATCSGSSGGAVCGSVDIAGNVVASIVPSLPVGSTVTFTINGTAPNDAQSLTNTASVAPPAGVTDPNPSNNSSSVTTAIGAQADVSILKSGPANVASGGAITYTLRIANAGPSAADGTSYADTLPAGISGIVANCGGETGGAACAIPTVAGNTVSGSVPTLPSGGAITITIDGTAPIGATTLTNTGTITLPANVADPNPANNTSSVDTTIGAAADIAVGKTVDNATPNVGDTVTFTITATNQGPNDATGVGITDGLPFGFGFVSATPSQGAYAPGSGLWTIGDLSNGASATLTIVATIDAPGALVNTATVSASDQTDPDTSNNSAGVSLNAGASADLAITKTVDNATPNVGDTVTFTITLANNGPDDSTGAEVTDALPAGLTLLIATTSQGTYDGATGIWTVGSIADGASATLTLAVSVDVAGAITNIATITGENENDPAQANNQAGAAVNGQLADIGVLKTVDNASPNVGDTVTFTVIAHNSGPNAATGVVVTDNLPAGLALVSATPSQGTFVGSTWSIGALDPAGAGATATLTIVATVQQSGVITNTASVTASDQTDPNSSNDSASASLNGNPLADLAIVKSGPASAAPDDTLVYTIVVTNNGPSDAGNVVVDDPMPGGITFVGNAGACATPYPCTLGALASGASATITTTALVPANYAGAPSIVNIATVASDTPDPDNTNNQDSAATTIIIAGASADLAIVKSGPASVGAGATITYTLAISNLGPDGADGATYDDALPPGVLATAATCGGESGGASCGSQPVISGSDVTGAIGLLPSGGAVVVSITATAPDVATTLTNVATIAVPAGTTDPNPGNDSSSVDTVVIAQPPQADLAIVKVGPAAASPGANVAYKLSVTNNGPDDAANVIIDDPAPPGLTFVSASSPCASGFPCALGALTNGASTVVIVTFAVDSGASGSVTNTAAVSSDTTDPVAANNSSIAITPIMVIGRGLADLSVAKSGPGSAIAGGTLTYQVTVANDGPDPATNVVLVDPTPPGLTLIAADAPCASGFPCALGTLASGASVALGVTYAVAIDAGGTTVTNTAAAASDTPDPDGNNNVSSVTTVIVPVVAASADLAVRKTGPVSVDVGAIATYTIAVTNNGPDAAVNAMLADPTPPGLAFVDASAPCAGGFPCALGTLASGSGLTVTARFQVNPGAPSQVINTATATSDTSDPDGANSSSSAVTTVLVGGANPVQPVPAGGRWSLLLIGLLLLGGFAAEQKRRRRR